MFEKEILTSNLIQMDSSMICPKCNYDQSDGQESCLCCGVIFSRLHTIPPADIRRVPLMAGHNDVFSRGCLKNIQAEIPREESLFVWAGRLLVWLGLVVWGVKFMFTPVSGEGFNQSYMHLINLPFMKPGMSFFQYSGVLYRYWVGRLASC